MFYEKSCYAKEIVRYACNHITGKNPSMRVPFTHLRTTLRQFQCYKIKKYCFVCIPKDLNSITRVYYSQNTFDIFMVHFKRTITKLPNNT